jgi:hypothetical protein
VPALPVVPNVVEVRYIFSDAAGQTFGCRQFLKYSAGPPTATTLITLAQNVTTHYVSALLGYQSNEVALEEVIATDLASAAGARGSYSANNDGGNSNKIPSLGTCTVIDFEINRRYRGGKPRIYLPIGTIDQCTTSTTWQASYVSAINAAWSTFQAAVLADTYTGFALEDNVNVSYYEGFTLVTNPITGRGKNVAKIRSAPLVDNIVGHTTRTILGSQRRRLKLKS